MTNDSLEFLTNLVTNLKRAQYEAYQAIKVEELYGKWGMTFAFQIGPYLCWIPPLITVILFIVFRRKKLLGVTQIFILSIMVADLIYTTISIVRDTSLRILGMNYGFLEHHICLEVVYSFRVQVICHATSVWLKSLMSLHQMLLVGFPLKVKLYNLSAAFYSFLIFHTIMCLIFFIGITIPTYDPIPMIQVHKLGNPARRINGCKLRFSEGFIQKILIQASPIMADAILWYNQVLPFVLHFIIIVALVILLTKHIRTLSILMHNVSIERIKYLSLLKVNIGLGISFFLQELPILFFSLLVQSGIQDEQSYDTLYTKYQGVAISIMSISFTIGKPVDLLIYASLSQTFKQEIRKLFKCSCRSRRNIQQKDKKISVIHNDTERTKKGQNHAEKR